MAHLSLLIDQSLLDREVCLLDFDLSLHVNSKANLLLPLKFRFLFCLLFQIMQGSMHHNRLVDGVVILPRSYGDGPRHTPDAQMQLVREPLDFFHEVFLFLPRGARLPAPTTTPLLALGVSQGERPSTADCVSTATAPLNCSTWGKGE